MYTTETKSLLAKLMATENITVIHQPNLKTASFNLHNRTLHCPIWKDMDGDLYDLLLGHEISHALRTPLDGWTHAVEYLDGTTKVSPEEQKAFHHFLNVVEDVRIEKLIKQQYPGLRRPMFRGYRNLLQRDFFGLSKVQDYNALYLIDKINLSYKVGTLLNIRFGPKEQPFIEELEKMEAWNEAVSLAIKLYRYSQKEQQQGEKKKQENQKNERARQIQEWRAERDKDEKEEDDEEQDGPQSDEEEGSDEENEEEGSEGGSDTSEEEEKSEKESEEEEKSEKESEKTKEGDGEEENAEGEENEELDAEETEDPTTEESEGTSSLASEDGDNDEDDDASSFIPRAATAEDFQRHEEDLIDKTHSGITYVEVPTPNLKDILVPAKVVNTTLTKFYTPKRPLGRNLLKQFHDKNDDYISLLAKEFEMKKAARTYKSGKLADSGDIDITRLAQYRIEDNIFRKLMIVEKGKSHGLVLLLDKSSSMTTHFRGAMEQLLVLAMFCRKVNIPFTAYSFGNSSGSATTHDFAGRYLKPFSQNENEILMKELNFRELINSRMGHVEFNQAITNHLLLAKALGVTHQYTLNQEDTVSSPRHETLSSTPLNEALVVLRDLLRVFKKENRLDIVNAVIVHDGESDGNPAAYGKTTKDFLPIDRSEGNVTLRDRKEHIQFALDRNDSDRMTRGLLKWIRMTTGCGVFGFYIISPNNAEGPIQHRYRDHAGIEADPTKAKTLAGKLRAEKFLESYSEGYTRFFFIPGSEDLVVAGKYIWAIPPRNRSGKRSEKKLEEAQRAVALFDGFSKATKRVAVNRVLVNKFIDLIAVRGKLDKQDDL